MKKIILIQNSENFTVDISQFYNPKAWSLFLIINTDSYNALIARAQEKLFEKISVCNVFNLKNLALFIREFINDTPKERISIVTNSEACIGLAGLLRDKFDLTGLSAKISARFSNKIIMKQALTESNIEVPRYRIFEKENYQKKGDSYLDQMVSHIKFPMFAKPSDASNSRFTSKLSNRSDLLRWVNENRGESRDFELNEFIEGAVYHVDSFIKDSKIILAKVCEYSTSPSEFSKGEALGSVVLPENLSLAQEILRFNQIVLNTLEYSGSGVTHLELFKNPHGNLIFLEIAARCGGAYLPEIYERHLGVNLFGEHFKLQLSGRSYFPEFSQGPYVAVLYFPFPEGMIVSVSFPSIQSNFRWEVKPKPGERFKKSTVLNKNEIAATLIIWNQDFKTLYEDFSKVKKAHLFDVRLSKISN